MTPEPASSAAETSLPEHGDLALCLAYFRRFDVPRSARILDLGTRYGSFVNALGASGYSEVQGIDIDEEALHRGRAAYPHLGAKLLSYDGTSLPFESASFDVITAFDVLEHTPDPDVFLDALSHVLKPGGRLIFQTPNRYINIPWEILHHRSLTKWRTFHCSLQSLRSLRALLESAGFEAIQIEKFNMVSVFKDHQARQELGLLAPLAIGVARRMPLPLYPNFWGHATRPMHETEGGGDV